MTLVRGAEIEAGRKLELVQRRKARDAYVAGVKLAEDADGKKVEREKLAGALLKLSTQPHGLSLGVCMSIHPEGESCSHIGRMLVPDDLPVRPMRSERRLIAWQWRMKRCVWSASKPPWRNSGCT